MDLQAVSFSPVFIPGYAQDYNKPLITWVSSGEPISSKQRNSKNTEITTRNSDLEIRNHQDCGDFAIS